VLAHWDEAESARRERGHLAGTWTLLGRALGTKGVGVNRVQVDPGKWSTPQHCEMAEEEIFFVLDGSGILLQNDAAHEVRAGDCIVHRAAREDHTLRAGDDGLDYLVYSNRSPTQIAVLPRAGVSWVGGLWAELGTGDHPWAREVAAGEPDVPEPSERPANIVNLDEVEGDFDGSWKRLGRDAGAERTGLNWGRLDPGESDDNAHCHSAEEEVFVILDGEGTLFLGDEEHPVHRGHVVHRPPATGVAHSWRAGDEGLTVLFYGTREPNDIIYYPNSNEIYFKGVGVVHKLG
jgi:uncharacterized cupin superfamily protein